jgi:outer membrane protein assembly factor BamB
MTRFWIVCIIVLSFIPLAHAKKQDDFSLSGNAVYKTQNLKVLSRKWSKSLKPAKSARRYYPEINQPTIVDGMAYVGTHGGYFYAIDMATGKQVWNYKNEDPIAAQAAVGSGKVFVSDLEGHLLCFGQADGQLLWKQYVGQEMLGQPTLGRSHLYVLKGEQEVIALKQDSGKLIWHRFIRTFIKKLTMRGHAGIVADGSSLYLGLADGHLYRLSASDGKILWDKNLTIPLRTFKDVDAKVVVDGDSLYVGGYFGAFYRIKKSSGSIVWTADIGTGVPAAVFDNLVVASDSDGNVFGIDKKTGKQQWFNPLNGSVASAPARVGQYIFVSTFKNDAFLLDPQTGNQVQKLGVGDGSIATPEVAGDTVLVMTHSAKLLAFESK